MADNEGKQPKSGSQLSLIEDFDNSIFESILPIVSEENSKYPTLLSIVPLFAAGDREKYTTDQHEGLVYPLERGRIRRIGAGLDVYDEDILIAILQLAAEKKLVGPPEFMPVALPSLNSKNTTVYKGKVSAGTINSFLGRSDGGSDLLRTRDSIRRLANQRLWFEGMGAGKGKDEMEGVTDFFKYTGPTDLKGDLIIQISPEMVNLLKSYEVIDMTIRRKLNDIAKAVHRFFLPQQSKFSIKFDDLAEAICYEQGGVALKRSLIGRKETTKQKGRPNQLDILVELGFLQEWAISGTGRNTPFVLSIVKRPPTQKFLKALEAQLLTVE